jgi:fructose/tagatose bisphosphate aldolase
VTEYYPWLALPFVRLDHAAEHGYGVPAFSINSMQQGLAIMATAAATELIDALEAIHARLPNIHLVLHGSSLVPQELQA